jgi:hypothetical protein
MTAAQQIRWKQQTVNVHYHMFIAGHSLLRFSPCYKSGGGIWEFEKKMKVRFSLNQKRVNALAPPLAYNVFGLGEVPLLET